LLLPDQHQRIAEWTATRSDGIYGVRVGALHILFQGRPRRQYMNL